MGFSASLVNPEVSQSVAGWSWKMMEESWHMVCGQCWLLKAEGRWDGDSKIRTRRSLLWVLSGKEFPLLAPLPEADVPGSSASASASGPLVCSPSPSSMLLASHHTSCQWIPTKLSLGFSLPRAVLLCTLGETCPLPCPPPPTEFIHHHLGGCLMAFQCWCWPAFYGL